MLLILYSKNILHLKKNSDYKLKFKTKPWIKRGGSKRGEFSPALFSKWKKVP